MDPIQDPEKASHELETGELASVPIFSAGKWTSSEGRTREWTEGDLDEIAENARTLSERLIPFVRVDHTDAETHKRITGRFKLGDLTNIRRVGRELVADIVRIPKKALELMKAGIFGRPSAEIVSNFKDEATGKTFGKVLWGAALLSAKHPAVTTLDDIYNLFGDATEAELYAFDGARAGELFERQDEPPNDEGGQTEMTPEEVQAKIDAALSEQAAKFEAEKKTLLDENEALKAKDAEHQKAEFEAGYAAIVEKGKKDGKIIPAQEEALRVMVDGWSAKFEAEKKDGSVLDAFAKYVDGLPVVVKLGEAGVEGDPKEKREEVKVGLPKDLENYAKTHGYEIDAESAEKDAKVREVMKSRNMNYCQALSEVEGIEVVVHEPKTTDAPKE